MASVTCSNLGGKEPQNDEVQNEGNEHQVIHHSDEWNFEIDGIECVEPEQDDGRQEPERPARVPEREQHEAHVLCHEPGEPEQAKHFLKPGGRKVGEQMWLGR